MSEQTILVIDDSATIRQLVDRSLTPVGYQVILAATAEEGLELAPRVQPDLILLDHQLPGTTGTEVCHELLRCPETAQIPVVASSTLRKRAYVEYTDLSNVVDMLPKPYTAELLVTTVENALNTAALVVESQSQGTAIPEVIQQSDEADLQGAFGCLNIRELLDFLSNAGKTGTLEVSGAADRTFFFVREGRIIGVSASGFDADRIAAKLPESLQNLEPVLRLTVGGRARAELDSLVQLLDRKVVDPRMLRKLLAFQASQLTWHCFNSQLKEFRFSASAALPAIHQKTPLNSSLLALLIDASRQCDSSELTAADENEVFTRRAIRGQSLDRAGVSAQHMQLLKALAERKSAADLATELKLPVEEVHGVLRALELAELVERQTKGETKQVTVFESDPEIAQRVRAALNADESAYYGKVVRDRFGLQLVLKRGVPDALVLALDADGAADLLRELRGTPEASLTDAVCIGIVPTDTDHAQVLDQLTKIGLGLDGLIERPFDPSQLFALLDKAFDAPQQAATAEPTTPSWRSEPEEEQQTTALSKA